MTFCQYQNSSDELQEKLNDLNRINFNVGLQMNRNNANVTFNSKDHENRRWKTERRLRIHILRTGDNIKERP